MHILKRITRISYVYTSGLIGFRGKCVGSIFGQVLLVSQWKCIRSSDQVLVQCR